MQNIVVALIVFACFAYAAQALLPAAARRALARMLLSWCRWPVPVALRLQRAAREPMAGCGCEGCDRPAKEANAATIVAGQARPIPIPIQRRRP